MVIFHLEQLDTVTKTQHFLFCFVLFVLSFTELSFSQN